MKPTKLFYPKDYFKKIKDNKETTNYEQELFFS